MTHEAIELRIYRLKPGMREKFIGYFNKYLCPLHEEIGMTVMGQFTDLEDENVFIWMRGFKKAESREAQRSELYDGKLWSEIHEAEVMPMIEDYSNVYLMAPTGNSNIK
jgi:hypothetical protein